MKALVLVVATACADIPLEPEDIGVAYVLSIPGEKDQGRYLNGSLPDGLAANGYHLHVSTIPALVPPGAKVTRVEATNGALVAYNQAVVAYSGYVAQFVGMEFTVANATNQRLRITGVIQTSGGWRYTLDSITGSAAPTSYCGSGIGAIATSGRWTLSGAHEVASAIDFSCDDGVITKCFTWGYDPGSGPIGGPVELDPWRVHQTCTRMARADRCGIGETNTLEETTIWVRDRYPNAQPNIDDYTAPPLQLPPSDPPPPDHFWFESAWTESGAICLSRERWNSMPLDDDTCMPDPRKDKGVLTCDQIGLSDLKGRAILFNGSKIGQLYLNRWHKGSDQLVTVRGMAGQNGQAQPPFPGFVFDEQVGLLMRNPPGSLALPGTPDPDLASVALFTRSGIDRVVTLSAPSAAYTSSGFEGYVYVDNPDGRYIPLYLYRAGTDYVSAPSPPVVPGVTWGSPVLLGYVDPP